MGNKHWLISEEKAFTEWLQKEPNGYHIRDDKLIKLLLKAFYAGIKYEQSRYEDDCK